VEGWNAVGGVLTTTGAVSPIVLPTGLVQPPTATTTISVSANLDASAAVGSTDATFSSPIQVYDSNGTTHALTITYAETAVNTWSYAVTIPAADISAGASTTVASGTLTFGANGNLLTPNAAAGSITLSTPSLADGATMSASWNLYDASGNPTITQYAQANANTASSQNGTAAGQLTNMQIGANGVVVASFSNGTSENVAQIALASVFNPDSMQQLDGNSFAPTSATANPVIGLPSTGARGEITGGSLETSTVDIATEFTNLLQYERGYQANSKVITTEDQVIQQTLALITG
jgi:flagellar hook protein FlgE